MSKSIQRLVYLSNYMSYTSLRAVDWSIVYTSNDCNRKYPLLSMYTLYPSPHISANTKLQIKIWGDKFFFKP
jgi:hypothetical protein